MTADKGSSSNPTRAAGWSPVRIGFIGAGLMGAGIAGRLIGAGHRLSLFAHRNRAPLRPLFERGATEADDPLSLLEAADVLFTCVPDAAIVAALAEDLVPSFRASQIWIDVTTSRPEVSERIAARLAGRGAIFADAPVTGGPQQAADGALASLVGCAPEHFPAVEALATPYSKVVRRFGDPGRGHAAKLLNNLVTQGTMVLLADAYRCAASLGVDARALYEVMMTGAARSGTLEKAVGPALDGDYAGARFTLANAAKDLDYARDLVGSIAADREPVAAALAARLRHLVDSGHGDAFVSSMLGPEEDV